MASPVVVQGQVTEVVEDTLAAELIGMGSPAADDDTPGSDDELNSDEEDDDTPSGEDVEMHDVSNEAGLDAVAGLYTVEETE